MEKDKILEVLENVLEEHYGEYDNLESKAKEEAIKTIEVDGEYREATWFDPPETPDYFVDVETYTDTIVGFFQEHTNLTREEILSVMYQLDEVKNEEQVEDEVIESYEKIMSDKNYYEEY